MSVGSDLILAKIKAAAGSNSSVPRSRTAAALLPNGKRRVTIAMDLSLIAGEEDKLRPQEVTVNLADDARSVKQPPWNAVFEGVNTRVQAGTAELEAEVAGKKVHYGPVKFYVAQGSKNETVLVFFTPEDKAPEVEAKKEEE